METHKQIREQGIEKIVPSFRLKKKQSQYVALSKDNYKPKLKKEPEQVYVPNYDNLGSITTLKNKLREIKGFRAELYGTDEYPILDKICREMAKDIKILEASKI